MYIPHITHYLKTLNIAHNYMGGITMETAAGLQTPDIIISLWCPSTISSHSTQYVLMLKQVCPSGHTAVFKTI